MVRRPQTAFHVDSWNCILTLKNVVLIHRYVVVHFLLFVCLCCFISFIAPRRSHARPLLRDLHWLPIQHGIEYKVAVLTFKSRSSATALTYLSRHTKARVSEKTLRSCTAPLLDKPFTRTDFANRAFRCSAPTVWNSLPETIICCDSLSRFKSKLKTYFFHKAFD